MAKIVGKELPEDLFRKLSGQDLESQTGKAILICTIDEAGWPHPAMLSYLEVIALNRSNLRMATYVSSSTTRNMRRSGHATLSFIDSGMAYYVKGKARLISETVRSRTGVCKLNLEIDSVLSDQANPELEAEARVTSGVTYQSQGDAEEAEKARALLRELME
jgi:hypothetical protein